MDTQRIPLIRGRWRNHRRMDASGACRRRDFRSLGIAEVEVRKLSDVTNALGNLYRCHLTLGDGQASIPHQS